MDTTNDSLKITPEEREIFDEFIVWLFRYKSSIKDSLLEQDMDDEIILITCEDELKQRYDSMSQITQEIVKPIIDGIFRDSTMVRLETFIVEVLESPKTTTKTE